MALIAVSGHPGCRYEEVARLGAQRLGFELLTQSRLRDLTSQEFGAEAAIPDRAYSSLVTSILARLATEYHIVCCLDRPPSAMRWKRCRSQSPEPQRSTLTRHRPRKRRSFLPSPAQPL